MPADIKVEIPHVWFDLIGRVIPGAFLIVGLSAVALRSQGCRAIACRFGCHFFETKATIQVIAFVGFIAAAFTAGFLLASLGCIFDRIWDRFCPLDPKKFGPAARKLLDREFKGEKLSLVRSTALHILWIHPSALPLALLASKRDAEKQASGSFVWAAVFVYAELLLIDPHDWWRGLLGFLFIVALSFSAYCHYRKRVVETPLDGLAEIRDNPTPTSIGEDMK
jgi:hypothetical protein